ncbi:penicillin-binding protein 1C [Flammeovirga pectinis]|uniref:peptidoglycan glycosyltransferase n=1 Tax=Flammeovirga pectinis TaxID=2494373 RepID=A0A3Q9FQZ6_9BACT|nr:penicillin-binding protein 1C [Flammeovirga pectinis]AZQ63239.1 penicillin-binding protein 1C [Flammeovirga pectinis]
MIIVQFLFPYQYREDYGSITLSTNQEVLGATLNSTDKWRLYTPIDEVSPFFIKAIIEKEDKWFYYHLGINPIAIFRAAFNNLKSGQRTSGASTISMQVVRLLTPKKRTYFNKLIEVFKSIQLELTFSKKEILEIYINHIPYGGNIEGIKAASVLYLGKNPEMLSVAQATMLSIIPNRPTSLSISNNSDILMTSRNKWIKRFYERNLFDVNTYESALLEPLSIKRRAIPKITPHLNRKLFHKYPSKKIIKTYIDVETQIRSEQIVKNYARKIASYDIHNLAAVVIDNTTKAVVAYIGSQDFYDNNFSGQVDGVSAVRSPGSTLKPLIYGIGFDKGIITPKMKILDVPMDFGSYSPQNYDLHFNGAVTVEEALGKSLNIPAVDLLQKIGLSSFLQKLEICDFKTISRKKKYLGLSTALGGCGTRLSELSGLYSSFATEGMFTPIKFSIEDTINYKQEIISPESAFMITEILSDLRRPDLPNNYQNSTNVPKISWKTGTSYGRKDAWSIGYNKQFTIGVWCGNFDNEGVQELTGAQIATPLLFQIFRAIYSSKNQEISIDNIPDNINSRNVCAISGEIPSSFCEHSIEDWYIPAISHFQKCTCQKMYFIALDTSFSYCSICLPQNGGYKKKLFPNYSPQLSRYYSDEKIPYEKPPKHNPNCSKVISGIAPSIVSPVSGRTYYVTESNAELSLIANTSTDVNYLFWYINDKFIGKREKDATFFYSPTIGKNKISCSDDKGRNSDIFIFVK